MPIYEYECSRCGHRLEALQKISDAPLSECPACHEAALTKLISASNFRLKGAGWYETDFKKDGRKQLAETDSADKSGKADAGAGGKDTAGSGAGEKTDNKAEKKPAKEQAQSRESTGESSGKTKTTRDAGKSKPGKSGAADG